MGHAAPSEKPIRLHRLAVGVEPARAIDAAEFGGLRVPGVRVRDPRAEGAGDKNRADVVGPSERGGLISLDHLVRPLQERLGDCQAEGTGALQVDHQLERRRL